MSWKKVDISTPDGVYSAQAPMIISASRSTDIPAYYSDWFFKRLKEGYLKWKNPFNGVALNVSFSETRLIVFWSKNPKPIINHLEYLEDKNINYYFQYTLNDYVSENFERKVPGVDQRIDTFIELSEKIGKEKVIWRFDPYILTDKTGVDELLRKTEYIGNKLKNYTEKLVFSYADIKNYKKVANNLKRESINYQEFNDRTMNELAGGLSALNKTWGFEIGTCAEKIDLEKYGIAKNKCIDDDLIIRLFANDEKLMKFLGVKIEKPSLFPSENAVTKTKNLKDKGQRIACGCMISKDIGQYNTCIHDCVYCYANTSKDIALKNYTAHKNNPNNESILSE